MKKIFKVTGLIISDSTENISELYKHLNFAIKDNEEWHNLNIECIAKVSDFKNGDTNIIANI